MKILCVIDSIRPGGAQRQLVNLAIGFKKRGFEVLFLVYHHHDYYQNILNQNNIPVYEIIEPNYLNRLIKMRRFIRRGNFNAVLSFLQASNFICEIAGFPVRKWKLVVGERSANPTILKSFKLKGYRWFHLLADHVVANSNENLKMVRKINPLLSSKKCHVIYNTVDFEKWQSNNNYIPFKNKKFNLVIAATHRYLKNLAGLVEAINLLPPEKKEQLNVEWYGEITSDDSFIKAKQIIIKYKLENIFQFYEPIPDIENKFKTADLIGLFSYHEGLPNVVCEAMAAAKPVIASAISDIPFLISNEKMLFNPNNIVEISKTISHAMEMSARELQKIGVANYEKSLTLFDEEKIINQYLELLSPQNK